MSETAETILRLHGEGELNVDIARIAGCSPANVTSTLRRHGLHRNQKSDSKNMKVIKAVSERCRFLASEFMEQGNELSREVALQLADAACAIDGAYDLIKTRSKR